MTFWFILTIMITAAAVWLTIPLVRRFDRLRDGAAGTLEVYRDQLLEVERELQNGAIDDTQAQAARIEIKRRILTVDRSHQATMRPLSGHERNFAVIGATGIVVLGSVGLYALTGRPDLASPSVRADMGDDGLATFSSPPPGHPMELAAATDVRSTAAGASAPAGLPSVEEMIQRLSARLSQQPGDIDGWRTLGWSYLNIGRYSEAAAAYAKAVKLDPGAVELRSGRIEALIDDATGTVTTQAKTAIAEALNLDPRNARVRFFDGLAKEQDGDKAAALREWTKLLKDANPEDNWIAELKSRLSELRRDMGIEGGTVSDRLKTGIAAFSPKEPVAQTSATEKGPTADDVRAAEGMNPTERSAMIRGMVASLAGRLEQSPRDADGWIKLIRARVVLGDSDLAKQSLARGLEVFADDAAERDRIAASARQLGIAP